MTSAAPAQRTAGFVDLHAHSTASDGAHAPADVVRRAAAAGLTAIALTDHDTLAGVAEGQHAAAELGIRFVPGVELSAVEGDVETHILGLHIADVDDLEAELTGLRDMRRRRAERIVARLNELGVPLALDHVLEVAAGAAVGRPHVARALIADGWAVDFRDAFERYLGNGKPAYVAKDALSLVDAIALIHRAGGLAILAHPGGAGTVERVQSLIPAGLDGLEVLHPGHGAGDVQRLGALCDHFRLVRSGGSDWHGATAGARVLGVMRVPPEWLVQQDDRIADRRAPPRVA